MKKSIISVLCICMLLCSCTALYASAAKDQATLYSYYGNNMLFKQNDDAVLAGTATAGTKITCSLRNANNNEVAFAESITSADGTFSVSFRTPNGSFDEYSIKLSANGQSFAELTGVVFGELWIAGGQSNMQISLSLSTTGSQMVSEQRTGSDALRFLFVPHNGTYKGDSTKAPAQPLVDYETPALWYKGSDMKVYELSAVGYYFAENLIQQLNMPVGILSSNLGGSSILTWLSRETIENNNEILADCQSDGRYIPLNKWKESDVNFGIDMTSNFNTKMAPLKNFRVSGMIWYQGESDLSWAYGRYSRAFDALQTSYTKYFNYKDGLLPIVFTQLASYSYGDLTILQNKNIEFANMQQQNPDSRALTSILDVPLDYTSQSHAIHPLCKKEVGDKMAFAAMGLVYDSYDSYTTATPSNVQIKDDSIYVTFRDVGDGLIADGEILHSFTICGSDGIYVPANAQITSTDTIRIYSDSVAVPASAAYAYSQTNLHANLFASKNGVKTLAVSPFVTDFSFAKHFWHNDAWTTCDFQTFWHCHSNEYSGFYNTWNAYNANTSYVKSSLDAGNALRIQADGNNDTFCVLPNFTYQENGKTEQFQDIDLNWSDYGTLTFFVKANTDNAVRFENLKISIGNSLWFSPAIKDTQTSGCEIPSDGQYHCITLDLNRLYPYANTDSAAYSSTILNSIQSVEFIFTDKNADLCIDNISFTADGSQRDAVSEKLQLKRVESFFAKIKAFFTSVYVKILLLFKR